MNNDYGCASEGVITDRHTHGALAEWVHMWVVGRGPVGPTCDGVCSVPESMDLGCGRVPVSGGRYCVV